MNQLDMKRLLELTQMMSATGGHPELQEIIRGAVVKYAGMFDSLEYNDCNNVETAAVNYAPLDALCGVV